MNFDLSDEQELIRQTVREFAVDRVAPVSVAKSTLCAAPFERA